ncbi:MAG: molecular chaperone HtpG [Alphaproteobacteria bacterium]|jgi:molecular chaperone HtpG
MSEEKMQFQAEVGKILDIVVNALYSNTDIFLRELISNASDACDKLRYAAIVKPDIAKGGGEFKINLYPDKDAHTLTISDNGIGMNKEDLIRDLGSIGRSGSAEFLKNLTGDKQKDATIIGQFGVGFYSAFMVADRVEVRSRKAGEEQGWLWASDGAGSFTISEEENVERGTKITLHLKPDHYQYADAGEIRQIVRQFSDHIAFPVIMHFMGETETVNMASALWTRNKADITQEQYYDFYRHISHAFDDPWDILHYKAEGTIEYTALMFIPTKTPFDLFQPNRNAQIKLYINRVFITDQIPDMLPNYLRFVKGVIDTRELPLNVSREMLQKTAVLAKIKTGVTRRILGELKKRSENETEYLTFWNAFGLVLKEGLFEDVLNRDDIAELCRFYSTHGDGLTSLADYVSRMKDGQKSIYYVTGDNLNVLRNNPQLEGFAARGIEVLLLTDPIDEFWPQGLTKYRDFPIKTVGAGAAELETLLISDQSGLEEKAPEKDIEALTKFMKEVIGDEVKEVRTTDRLTKSPVALTTGEGEISIHLERLMRQHNQPVLYASTHYLDINPRHPLIKKLAAKVEAGDTGDSNKALVQVLFDQAKIIEGEPISDPAAFSERVTGFMLQSVS